jgi:sugar phosphate isomerase/epimerase
MMDVGFVTYYSPEIVDFASKAGFDSLEVFVNPGSSLDLDRLTSEELDRARDDIRSHGLRVSTLRCSTNHLVADRAARADNNAYFLRALKLCRA